MAANTWETDLCLSKDEALDMQDLESKLSEDKNLSPS